MGSIVTRSLRRSNVRAARVLPVAPLASPAPAVVPAACSVGACGHDLSAAAERLIADVPPILAHVEAETLATEVRSIACACCRGTEVPRRDLVITPEVRRVVVDHLRAELLRAWSRQLPPQAVMMRVLQNLEAVHQSATADCAEAPVRNEWAMHGGLALAVELAHDMRSPLTSILFLSELLHRGEDGEANPVRRRQMGIVYGAALSLVGLTSDMMEMARGGGRLGSTPVPFSVNEVLRSVANLVQPIAEQKDLRLEVQMLETEHRIGHSVALGRVLLNLATNALKFTHEGFVMLSAQPAGENRVEFAVRDTGAGIPPTAMSTLYEPFRREPTRQSGYMFSGTGLGLAICRRLVSAMDSRLEITTEHGWGTRFSFQLELPPASTL